MIKLLRTNCALGLILIAGLFLPQLSHSQTPTPLVRLSDEQNIKPSNSGSLGITFTKSASVPGSTSNRAPSAGASESALDFGTTTGNYYVESDAVADGLKNLSAFTLTGWVNARSLTTGSGSNRIISWINNGGDGVDLVLQNNGSLRLGVDGWPDNSPAVSSANKVTANASAAAQNWIFFAVTYQANGQVSFYFGNSATDATLDVSKTYVGPGVTGSAISKLSIGAFNSTTRNAATWDRMFRGLLDDLRVYGSALSVTDIVTAQRNLAVDNVVPTPPTNLRPTSATATSIGLDWDGGTDNVGIAAYEIYDNTTLLTVVGNVTSHMITGLEPGRFYDLALKSKDAVGNTSGFSTRISVFTNLEESGQQLVYMHLNDIASGTPANIGEAHGLFTTGVGPSNTFLPGSSLETPPVDGEGTSADFGVIPGNSFIESQAPIDQLKNLSAFTIMGWVNCRSSVTGSGGNRIVSWINNGGDGVDLVYQSNGSLRLGVDGWPDNSPAFSNPNKVTTNVNAPHSNWVFFAVTYQSNGQVQYYFGTDLAKATLDATRTYNGPGITGSNIGKFAIGSFNSATRNAATYDRMFRGLIDNVVVYNSVLPLSTIIYYQGKSSTDITPPGAPNLVVTSKTLSTISLSWTGPNESDLRGYKIYNNGNIIANAPNNSETVRTYTLINLTPNTPYNLTIKGFDYEGNLSSPSNTVSVTTDATGIPLPLIDVKFEGIDYFPNEGTTTFTNFLRTSPPNSSTLVPNLPNNMRSVDFGTLPGDFYIWSAQSVAELGNLNSFTLTGWLNNRSSTTGEGGNKLISWTGSGGDGVDLVFQNDGSLRLGVDEFATNSPAVSSAGKITTDASAGASNWVFFAVTYQPNGQVQFYFGDNSTDATLDVSKTYAGRGAVGSNIGRLAFGAASYETKSASTYLNMFRGLIDNFKIYGSNLSLADIRAVQRGVSSDVTPPSAPTALTATEENGTSVTLSWKPSTDNVAVVAYNVYDGGVYLQTAEGGYRSITVRPLTPGSSHEFTLKARDAASNLSAASNVVSIATKKLPLMRVTFDGSREQGGFSNIGTLGGFLVRGDDSPISPYGSAPYSMTGNTLSLNPYNGLKNLSAFTITGWVNRTSNNGTERILSWMPVGGGDGVELLVQAEGKLKLGVNESAENSAAMSSAFKITVNPAAPQDNWVFFAVTYESNGQTHFYFGNDAVDASLDALVNYPTAGNTGSNISNFNLTSPAGGYIDEVRVYNSVLTRQEIVAFQHGAADNIAPTSPGTLSGTYVDTTIGLQWSQIASDNIGVTSYDVFDGSTLIKRHVPEFRAQNYTRTNLFDLISNRTYNLSVKARDSQGNYSPATNVVQVTTPESRPTPLVWLKLDELTNAPAGNYGSTGGSYNRSSGVPSATDNVPSVISTINSADFGTSSANAYIESPTQINELKNLSSFTITGWVNNRSNVMGSGGNRIVSWINNGGDGVDLVYQNDGSLRLGVDAWPDYSPAFSSTNKVPTNASAPASNWVFFAVTYVENGSVEFYFGSNGTPAALDVTKNYPGRGASGSNIGKLAIGNFNDATRTGPSLDRIFRGLIDDVRIYGSKLTQTQIAQIQGLGGNSGGRLAMSPEQTIKDEFIDEVVLSQNYPNPFDDVTNVEVNIPHSVKVARMTVYDLTGRTLQNILIEGRGPTSISVERGAMRAGVYIYSLTTDGKNVAYKRMMIK
ncbi:MAG: LamG-like jellyroll fold domain-containing protein [Chryseolinea sp.]